MSNFIATDKVRLFQIFKMNVREANVVFPKDEILEQVEYLNVDTLRSRHHH